MMESIWDGEGLFLSLALSLRMNSLLTGHLSEAEVWPGPWVEQVGVQLGSLEVWAVERQVGQTLILEQIGSFWRWLCFLQVRQYLGVIWMCWDLLDLRRMVWWILVSLLRKAWAEVLELKVTRIA